VSRQGGNSAERTPRVYTALGIASYYSVYLTFVAGWLSFRSRFPWIVFPVRLHPTFTAILAFLFCLPLVLLILKARFGTRTLLFSALPAVFLIGLIYLGASLHYYATTRHPFDPFLQMPPHRFRTPSVRPGERVFRIITLGGSTTLNSRFPEQYNYPYKLQTIVQKRYPAVKIEVLNAGMDWYTTKHSLIQYVTYCNQWHADLIIVMHAINDIYRSFAPPEYAIGSYNDDWSHFYGPAINGANPPTFEHHLLEMLVGGLGWYSTAQAVDYPLERYVSLSAFDTHLSMIVHYAKSDGSTVLLMTEPSLYKGGMNNAEQAALRFGKQFCVTVRTPFYREYASSPSLLSAMNAFNARTRDIAASNQVMLLDADRLVPKNLRNFIDDVHYTEAGSSLLAELVAARITDSGVIAAPSRTKGETTLSSVEWGQPAVTP